MHYIINSFWIEMLKTSLSFLSKFTNSAFISCHMSTIHLCPNTSFFFCVSRRHAKYDELKNQDPMMRPEDLILSQEDGRNMIKHPNPKEPHHIHGPKCKHDHGHHHDKHHHGQIFNRRTVDRSTPPPNVKLSQLSFEQLINIQTKDSLKYAHMIYQQEEHQLKKLQEDKENQMKNIQHFKKLDMQIQEKEKMLEQHILEYEEQASKSEKRAEKLIQESKIYGIINIAKEVLQVVDDLDRCVKFASETIQRDNYIDLIVKTEQMIKGIMAKYEIEEFDPIDQPFDPNSQEGIVQIPTPKGYKPGYVAKTFRTGYTIHGRLLRSARVAVLN